MKAKRNGRIIDLQRDLVIQASRCLLMAYELDRFKRNENIENYRPRFAKGGIISKSDEKIIPDKPLMPKL